MASSFSINDILNLDGRNSAGKSSEIPTTTATKQLPAREMNTATSRKRKREGDSTGNCSESPSSDSEEEKTPSPSSSVGSKGGKRSRTAYSTAQLRALEYAFRICPYPDSYARQMVAKTTGISEAKIQIWFQNRRARFRKREKPFEQPTRSHPRPILPRPSPDPSHFCPSSHMTYPSSHMTYPSSYFPHHHYPPFSHHHAPYYPAHFNFQLPVKFTGAQSRSRSQN